jgi:ABC-type nitrate/sulfonate/bicarbonate transport system permease component
MTVETKFQHLLTSLASTGLAQFYSVIYGIAVIMLCLGAYKMLSDGTDGMEALVLTIKRIVIATIIVAFAMNGTEYLVKAFTGVDATSVDGKQYNISQDLFDSDGMYN